MTTTGSVTLDPSAPKDRVVVEVVPDEEVPDRSWFLRDRPAFKAKGKIGME